MVELLQQVRVLDPVSHTDRVADVLFIDQEILAIEERIIPEPDTIIADGSGCVLAPGLVDLYSHSGEPGHESRETLASLTEAAIAGGFTRMAILPDTEPTIDHAGMAPTFTQGIATPGQWQFWGALTQQREGAQMVEYGDLQEEVLGFSDGIAIADWTLLYQMLDYLQPFGKPIALVPQFPALQKQGVIREGTTALKLGLPGDPVCSETIAIAGILELVAATQTPVHLMKVSTARGVELIAQAKAQGLPITASTTWLHLICDVDDLTSYDPCLHLSPPLGTPRDREALCAGVKSGAIDAIAVDHTPHTYEEKNVSFAMSPVGAIGLELALPVLWHQLVETGMLSALELWQALSTNPAQCLGQGPGRCAVDEPVELILFDPREAWVVEAKSLRSRSHNTHLLNQTLHGKVKRTFIPAV